MPPRWCRRGRRLPPGGYGDGALAPGRELCRGHGDGRACRRIVSSGVRLGPAHRPGRAGGGRACDRRGAARGDAPPSPGAVVFVAAVADVAAGLGRAVAGRRRGDAVLARFADGSRCAARGRRRSAQRLGPAAGGDPAGAGFAGSAGGAAGVDVACGWRRCGTGGKDADGAAPSRPGSRGLRGRGDADGVRPGVEPAGRGRSGGGVRAAHTVPARRDPVVDDRQRPRWIRIVREPSRHRGGCGGSRRGGLRPDRPAPVTGARP